jgi:hypothetical protein
MFFSICYTLGNILLLTILPLLFLKAVPCLETRFIRRASGHTSETQSG